MKKRLFAALLATALIATIFAGCQEVPGTPPTTVTNDPIPVETTSEVTGEVTSAPAATTSKSTVTSKPATTTAKPANNTPTTAPSTQQPTTTAQPTTAEPTTTAQPTTPGFDVPDLVIRRRHPPGWIDGPYRIIPATSDPDATSDVGGGDDDGSSTYDVTTLDTKFVDAASKILTSLAGVVWTNDGKHIREYIVTPPQGKGEQDLTTLWPYGGYLEAAGAAYNHYGDTNALFKAQYLKALANVEEYNAGNNVNALRANNTQYPLSEYPNKGKYIGYTCYPGSGGGAQLFYDDDAWIMKEFMHAYKNLGDQQYLTKATRVMQYICETAWDDSWIGGGLYWMDLLYPVGSEFPQKNTCINAPTVDGCLEMYDIVNDLDPSNEFAGTSAYYLTHAKKIYSWTIQRLYDNTGTKPSYRMFDKWVSKGVNNYVLDRGQLPYNDGMMIGSSARLYKATKEQAYLDLAIQMSEASAKVYTPREKFGLSYGNPWRRSANPWFNSYLVEGWNTFFNVAKECAGKPGYTIEADVADKYMVTMRNALSIALSLQYYGDKDAEGWIRNDWGTGVASPVPAKDITVMQQSATARVLFILADNIEDYPNMVGKREWWYNEDGSLK